jgi:hypothetical protein
MPLEIDIFAADRCSVTAPAGCGKTQLIADTLAIDERKAPVLILTHTNAGVAAIRDRLQRARAPSKSFRLSTIDGFAIRMISRFPMRSGHNPSILEINDADNDYPAIRAAAAGLLAAGHVSEVLRATYSRLIVDEYQDCNLVQHTVVDALATALPTVVLGDPMQAVFGFRGNRLVNWRQDVEAQFPAIGALGTPWRWRNVGTEAFGRWLLRVRDELQGERGVDLRQAPEEVEWVQLHRATAGRQRLSAAQTDARGAERTVMIIGESESPQRRHYMSRQTPGATSVEAVELSDLVGFSRRFDLTAPNALALLVEFAADIMTQVGATAFLRRVDSIRLGRARTPASPAEAAAVAFSIVPTMESALTLLQRLEDQANARAHRREILHCCTSAMRAAAVGDVSFPEAVLQVRERNRHLGRSVPRRAVGSTLLLKGLEADVAVVTHPEGMDARHLYVALTRGARRLVVCSERPVLTPAQ